LAILAWSYTKSEGILLSSSQILVIPVSLIIWVAVTFITRPEPLETLSDFYKRVRPWGWWKPVSDLNPGIERPRFTPVVINWIFGVCCILFGMTGVGKVLLGSFFLGAAMIAVSLVSGLVVYSRLKRELAD
jgi:hypothetical protein